MKTKAFTATILALFLLAMMFTSLKAQSDAGCTRYFGWGSDPDGSAHCMSEESALPSNPGGVVPQGPLTVIGGQSVTFDITWSDWHSGLHDWAIYIGTISGTISYPPYNVPYPQLVSTTLLASWTNDITVFGDPPTVTGSYILSSWYVASGTLPNYNPKILPTIDSAPYGAVEAFVFTKNRVTVTIPTLPPGTYTIRIISTWTDETILPPPGPNDVRVLGNPLITLWGWPEEVDPNGYPWGEYVDIKVTVKYITVVPDPGFETNNEVTGLHYFYADEGCTAEIITSEKYAGRKSAHLYIPATAWLYATVKTDISPGSTQPSNVWFDDIVAPPIAPLTFMYKLVEGSHSPYWVFKIKIVEGDYDGDWLVLVSWQLDGLSPDGWTLYDNDDWHYLVLDPTGTSVLVNDFSTDPFIDPFTPDPGHWHHPLSEIQGYFDGTLETVQVSIGLWSFAEATDVYVDQMRVMRK